jgi:translation initiation factor 3 subunit D
VASIDIQSTWNLKDEIDLKALDKAKHFMDENPSTLLKCGSVLMYDKAIDRVNTKNDRPLDKTELAFPKVTTSDDPNIRDFAAKKVGNVFATDAILAVLMSCPRSIYPWDVVANRVGNQLFFDKRDGSTFDYVTVGETALNPPEEDNVGEAINQKDNLSKEATLINQAFSVQVLDRSQKPVKFDHPDPFAEEGAADSVCPKGYFYRKWDLEDGNVLVARCDVDGYSKGARGVDEFITVNALNEYDPKVSMDWRRTIDAQGSAVLAAELKSNANKLAQWTVRSILGGAEKMVFGFVSRTRMTSNQSHSILATQGYKTSEFARQISLRTSNMWGILKELIDRLMAQPEGRYVLLRDPNKASVRIFKVPADTFERQRNQDDESLLAE